MSAQDIIKSIEDAQLREVAEFKTGDTVRVHAKVKEGNRYCKKTGKWCWC